MAGIGAAVAMIEALAPKADPAVIQQAVEDYLEAHPEISVADGSITEEKLASDVALILSTMESDISDLENAIQSADRKKTPYQLAMGHDKGYISGTSPFNVNRGLNEERAIFAWLHCGKNTKVSVNSEIINGFAVYKYSIVTGDYIEKLGNVQNNTSEITIDEECIILIYVSTSYTDVDDYLETINNAIFINYAKPSTITQEYPCVFEYGSMDTATGNTSTASTSRLRSVSWVLVGAGTRILLEDTHAKINVLMYDMSENKGYIGGGGAFTNPIYVLPRDAYIKLYASNWRDNSFSSAAEMKPKIIFSEPSAFHVPDYYTSGSFIQTRRDKIIEHLDDCSYNGLNFFFITDVHWESNNRMSPSLLHYLREKTGVCDLIFNGDAITSYNTKVAAIQKYGEFRKAFSEWTGWHWMPVIGNHEFNNPGATPGSTAQLTPSEAFGMVLAENDRIINRIDKYSYYIDFTAVKIRIFFVGADYQSLIPSATGTAVASAISATPSDYKILVSSHIGLTGKGTTGEVETTLQPIVDALDAVHEKVIAVLTGHRHADGYLLTTAGVNIIATTCDATTEGGGLTRTRGTTGESAFECVQIDLTNSKIYLTRIGAGSNRSYDICQ